MVKDNVTAVVRQLALSGLYGMVKDFVHAADVGSGGDHCGQILQRAFQRGVQPGCDQQEQEKQWDADFSADQQNGACQGDGGDAEFQDQRGGDDEQRSAELGNDMAVFRIVNFPVQSLQIRLLRAAGFQIPEAFDAFLYPFFQCDICRYRFPVEIFLSRIVAMSFCEPRS